MATIIDSLVVTLGIDASAYRKGAKDAQQDAETINEAERKRGKVSQETSKAVAEGFTRARNELLSLAAAMLGANSIKGFFTNMVTGQATLGRLAHNLGMSARELDSWGAAAEQVGGTAQGIQSSFQHILAGFEAFKLGEQSPVVTAFRALGIAIADSNGQVRPMKDLMLDLAKALQGMPAQDQIRIAGMLGLDEGTLNLLRQGRDVVEQTQEQMFRISGVTEKSTEEARRAQAAWATFGREMRSVGQSIFEALGPSLELANDGMLKMSGWVRSHKDEIAGFFSGIVGLAQAATKATVEFTSSMVDKFQNSTIGKWLIGKATDAIEYGMSTDIAKAASGGAGAAPTDAAKTAPGVIGAASTYATSSKTGPRGIRNNNPGNIKAGKFAAEMGAVGSDGTFAIFRSPEDGLNALRELMRRYNSKGIDTVSEIISKFAPPSENNTQAYIASLAKSMGVNPGDHLKMTPDVLQALMSGITKIENGQMPYSARMMQIAAGGGAGGGSSVRSETNIGTISIQTRATDAPGIARSISDNLASNQRLQAASMGMR